MATFSQPTEDPALPSTGSEKPKRTRRGFGWVRKLPSGRYQASYLDPTGTRITAKAIEDGKLVPLTFLDKRTAEAWLSLRQSELIENRWKPPQAREPEETVFSEYADRWLASRELSPRTRAEYRKVLDGKRLAYFAEFTLEEISPAMVKQWWISHDDGYPTARRKAYDLLHAILATASQQDEDTDAPAADRHQPGPALGENQERGSDQQAEGQHPARQPGRTRHDHGRNAASATPRWCCSPLGAPPASGNSPNSAGAT